MSTVTGSTRVVAGVTPTWSGLDGRATNPWRLARYPMRMRTALPAAPFTTFALSVARTVGGPALVGVSSRQAAGTLDARSRATLRRRFHPRRPDSTRATE